MTDAKIAAWHRGMAVFHREPNSVFQQLHFDAAECHDRAATALDENAALRAALRAARETIAKSGPVLHPHLSEAELEATFEKIDAALRKPDAAE